METLNRLTFRVLLFALALVGCSSEAQHEEWKTVRQVVAESCSSLCAWQDRCQNASHPTCPDDCVAMLCETHDCTAAPVGDDAAIDECMINLSGNVSDGGCGTAVGLSQDCQDLFLTHD